MIVNLRGTNGSGKSTVIKNFLESGLVREIFGASGPRRPEAYHLNQYNLYIIGPYQTSTGGLDALSIGLPETIKLIEKYSALGHVLFEGVIISTTFGQLGNWMLKHRDKSIVAFLDTPLEECIRSLSKRESGHRGTAHVTSKYATIFKLRESFSNAGIRVEIVSRQNAFDKIRGWL